MSFEMAWQPGSSLIFLYSNGGLGHLGGYTFILDARTGRVCELNLGGWALRARWSSDGRSLAVICATEYTFPIHTSDLTVLDSITGNLIHLAIPQDPAGEQPYVQDFTWAPDNRHLLALIDPRPSRNSLPNADVHHDLYLVDFVSGQTTQLFPDYQSFVANGTPWNNLAWSPGGSRLLIRCASSAADRICLISVRVNGK